MMEDQLRFSGRYTGEDKINVTWGTDGQERGWSARIWRHLCLKTASFLGPF